MRNIAEILMAQLDSLSLRHLRHISRIADSYGIQAYLVGGAVRDALLGLSVSDIDITVAGLTPEFAQEAAIKLGGEIVTRSQFNTFALAASGRRIDLAMARHETYAHPGALPTVVPGSIEEDLARRDFTVNSMAVSLGEDSFGELLDPFDGQSDLKTGIIRVLHDDSFRDDSTRILRGIRYAVRLGFTLDAQTEFALRRDADYLDTISPARLRDEFERVLEEGRAVSILEVLDGLVALQAIHPALRLSARTLDALHRAENTQYGDKPALFLSILAYDMPASDRASFLERLRLTSHWRRVVEDTGLARRRVQDAPSIGGFSRGEIYMKLRTLQETAILGCALSENDSPTAQRLMLYLNELRDIKPMLSGNDLIALGVLQGPRIGELLDDLLEARLNQRIETRQDEINFIQARL